MSTPSDRDGAGHRASSDDAGDRGTDAVAHAGPDSGPTTGPRHLEPLPPELDPRGRHRHDTLRHRVRAFGLLTKIVASALSLALLVGVGYEWYKYRNFTQNLQTFAFDNGTQVKGHHDIDGKDQNILIVGNDDRSTATNAELKALGTTTDGGSLNTDTMMIIHVPANGASATLISLPRDSYVNIDGYGMGKLNSAYPDAYNAAGGSFNQKRAAGANLLAKTITELTGLTIDHYVQVDLLGFYRISNAVGGIQVNMCAAVQEPNSGINLHKGINTIQGKQALAFVRQRYDFPNGQGDLDRVQRQRYFLTAAFRKLSSVGIVTELNSLYSAIDRSLYIDKNLKPLDLARQLSNLSANNIIGKTIPTDGFDNNTPSGSVVVVDPAQVKAFVAKLIGTADSALKSAKTVAPSSVAVSVVNAGAANNAATESAATLRADGFTVTGVGDDTATANTVIRYSTGQESQAKTLAQFVPGATYQKVSGLSHVTLVLGSDGLKAIAKKASPTTAPSAPSTSTTSQPRSKAIDAGCIY